MQHNVASPMADSCEDQEGLLFENTIRADRFVAVGWPGDSFADQHTRRGHEVERIEGPVSARSSTSCLYAPIGHCDGVNLRTTGSLDA